MKVFGKGNNLVQKLTKREYGVSCHYYFNTKLLRNVICADSRTFRLVWKKHSKKPIYYENQKIYFDNYRVCYTVNGLNELPKKLYSLPHAHKIQEALICEARLSEVHQPCFLALYDDGWLRSHDLNTGSTLQEIFLAVRPRRFKYLTWDEEAHSVTVKTTLRKFLRHDSASNRELLTLVMLSVFPLEFVAQLNIYQNIFGKDVNDAVISNGLLCVSHSTGIVQLFSFERILQDGLQFEAKLGKHCKELNGITGSHPLGLPFNIELKERPSVLFEVKCADNDLQMGGIPWHYIIAPWNNRNTFKVYSMATSKLAINGTLHCDSVSIRPEKAIFHPDDSGRIIHLTSSELRMFSISTNDDAAAYVHSNFNINTRLNKIQVKREIQTRSGRRIHRLFDDMTHNAFDQGLLSFNYEDELDVIVIHGTVPYNSQETHPKTFATFYDNKTGTLLKKINLKSLPIEHLENNIILDRDVLINIRKEANGKQVCYLYRLISST